jgi:hypothetical protein
MSNGASTLHSIVILVPLLSSAGTGIRKSTTFMMSCFVVSYNFMSGPPGRNSVARAIFISAYARLCLVSFHAAFLIRLLDSLDTEAITGSFGKRHPISVHLRVILALDPGH